MFQCRVVLNMPVNFTFINFLIQGGATWWKTATRFALNKTKSSFLSLLTSWLQSKHNKKVDCTNIILSVNNTSHVSAILLQNAVETTSPFTDAWLTAYQVSNIHTFVTVARLQSWRAIIFSRVCLWVSQCVFDRHFYPSTLTNFDKTCHKDLTLI